MAKIRVNIRCTQEVTYDKVVTMDEEDYRTLRGLALGDDPSYQDAVEEYLGYGDIDTARSVEDIEIYRVPSSKDGKFDGKFVAIEEDDKYPVQDEESEG